MPFLNLPVELILLIAEDLESKDLNSLIQTNHYLAHLLTRRLHQLAGRDRRIGGSTYPAFHWAAYRGYEPLARLLLDKGCDIDARAGCVEETALHLAAWQGHEAVVRLLLDRGAAVDIKDRNHRSAVFNAVAEGRGVIVRLLFEKGADVFGTPHRVRGKVPVVILEPRSQSDRELEGFLQLALFGETGYWAGWRERGGMVFRAVVERLCYPGRWGMGWLNYYRRKVGREIASSPR